MRHCRHRKNHIDVKGLPDSGKEAGLQMEAAIWRRCGFSTDLRVQQSCGDELTQAMDALPGHFAAMESCWIVHPGEVIRHVIKPDYDPNIPAQALEKERMKFGPQLVSRDGIYLKTFTTAMALDSG